MAITYKDAGVDIDAGNALIDRIKPLARSTMRPEVLGGIGGFAALCRMPTGLQEPILVSGTDGVGTKLLTALATGRHDTVGIDLVAMCVNDVLVTGAEPLFFLDYFATGKLDVEVAAQVVPASPRAAARPAARWSAARPPSCPACTRERLRPRRLLRRRRRAERDPAVPRPGRRRRGVGLPSSGLHSNGHSLARKVVREVLALGWDATPDELGGATVADALLTPTIIYTPAFRALGALPWKAAAHITGGGLIENPPRIFADDALAIELDPATWEVPGVMRLIASRRDRRRTSWPARSTSASA
jgi:phosphoribosylformylglycinamidine cyclo-ligase